MIQRLGEVALAFNQDGLAEEVLATHQSLLLHNASGCVNWTQERLEELRDDIQARLAEVVLAPIAKACQQAIDSGRNRGTGAKKRILESFDAGGRQAVTKGSQGAHKALLEHYNALVDELVAGYLTPEHDPLQLAIETLTGEQFNRAKEIDQARREAVLAELAKLTQALASNQPPEAKASEEAEPEPRKPSSAAKVASPPRPTLSARDSQVIRRHVSWDLEDSPAWQHQEVLIPARIDRRLVFTVIDALAEVHSMAVSEVAQLAKVAERRVPGLLAEVARALNIEGAPVLTIDRNLGIVELNVRLLAELFELR